MDDVAASALSQPRFVTFLLALFAAMALTLAAIGIYGTISLLVSERTQEMGIRLALGADRPTILKLVLGQGMLLTAIGLSVGLAGAAVLTRTLSGLVYGVGMLDPLTFVAVPRCLRWWRCSRASFPRAAPPRSTRSRHCDSRIRVARLESGVRLRHLIDAVLRPCCLFDRCVMPCCRCAPSLTRSPPAPTRVARVADAVTADRLHRRRRRRQGRRRSPSPRRACRRSKSRSRSASASRSSTTTSRARRGRRHRSEQSGMPRDRAGRFSRARPAPRHRRLHRGAHVQVPRSHDAERAGVPGAHYHPVMRRCLAAACTALCLSAAPAFAQEPAHQHTAPRRRGNGASKATAFAGYNYQYRKFTDFDEFESQNWLMTALEKSFGSVSHLRIDRDVLVRAVHAARHRLAAGVPDRRDVQRRAARSTISIRTI